MSKKLVVCEKNNSVLIVKLSFPEKHNSLVAELRSQLGEMVRNVELDPSIRAVYITNEGKTFCAGGDFQMLEKACDPWSVHRRFRQLNHWLIPLMNLDRPVVVGMNGAAVGGGMGLALAGDLMIMSQSSKLIPGFFKLGALPDIGMMYTLPRLVGMAQAKNILFGGKTIDANAALNLGLTSQVVPDEELYQCGLDHAHRLASGPAEVMGLAKILMSRSFENPMSDMFMFEGLGQALAMSNPEFREGLSAALEKRSANFADAAMAGKNHEFN